MNARYLYKNTEVPLESFTSTGDFIEHELPAEDCTGFESDVVDELATQGSVYHSETDQTCYIVWRVIESGCVLELRRFTIPSQGTTINQPGATCLPVRFRFSANILPHVTFFTDPATRALRCIVLISCGVLYRLDLPLGSLFTKNLPQNFYRRYKVTLLQGRTPFMVHGVDFDNIVVSSKEGTIIYLKHQPIPHFNALGVIEQTDEDDFRESQLIGSLFNQIKNYILPSRRHQTTDDSHTTFNDEDGTLKQPISLTSHVHGNSSLYLIYLRRDRRIVIWSLNSNKHLETYPISVQEDDMETDLNDSDDVLMTYLNEFNPLNPLPSTPQKFIRVLTSSPIRDSMSFDFVVYIPTSGDGFFGIYRVMVDASGGLKQLNLIRRSYQNPCEQLRSGDYPFYDLVDMELTPSRKIEVNELNNGNGETKRREWRLWALWKRKRQTVLTYTHFHLTYYDASGNNGYDMISSLNNDDDIIGKRWEYVARAPIKNHDKGYLHKLPDLQTDHVKVCTDYLFCPGRFSASIINRALEKYVRHFKTQDSEEVQEKDLLEYESMIANTTFDLKQKVKQVVAKHIRLQNDPENDIPLKNDHKQLVIEEWVRFILLCIEVKETSRFPLSLSIIQAGHFVAVTQQDSISTIRVCDTLELFHYYTSDEFKFLNLSIRSTSQLSVTYPKSETIKPSDMIRLFKSMNLIVSPFLDVDLLLLERAIFKALSKPYLTSVRQSAMEFYESHLNQRLHPGLKVRIWKLLETSQRLERIVLIVLTALNDVVFEKSDKTGEMIKTTVFMDALISSSTADIIHSHYIIARNLYLLLVFLICTKPHLEMEQRVSMSMSTLYIFMILKWITEQSAYSDANIDRPLTAEDGMFEKFSDLSMANTKNVPELPDLRYSLLHSLIHQHFPLALSFRIQFLPVIIMRGVKDLLDKIEFLPKNSPQLMVMTPQPYSKFGKLLHVSGFLEHLHQYIQFLLETPSSLYLYGEQLLKERKFDKAAEKFIRAGSGFTNDMSLPSYTGEPIVPSQDYLPGNLTGYFRHVATLFENCEQPIHVIKFCKLALEAFNEEQRQSPEGRDLVSQMCSKIFANAMQTDLFDEAYNAMIMNPSLISRRANLRPFVVNLCEKRRSISLQQYPFLDLRGDLENILEFHARCHVATEAPNYSMICYSYYISCKKFRDAARIIYQYAKKIEDSSLVFDNFQKAMTDLASSYLSAINALEQVTPVSLAWFHYITLSPSDDDRSRKRTKYDEASKDENKVITEIISLPDLKKSYTLVMARLELGREFAEKVTPIKSQEAVKLCSYAGKFDLAISIAKLFEIPLDDVFERMTRKCLLPLNSNTDSSEHRTSWVRNNEVTQLIHGTETDKAWAMLRKYLDKYDKREETLCRYRAIVLRTMLTVNSQICIPEWLTSFYKTYNQGEHIKILMDFGRLSDAVTAVSELLEMEVNNHDGKVASHCLPWNIIENVKSLLNQTMENPQLKAGKETLEKLKGILDEVTETYFKTLSRK
ncbi:7920_t:CDS:10 [Acaulospora morrowiae]|uniref:7920_t:CDS:1 n=1 Tax=Acaulospora morrowiae TaxID=94023 RepID=A0A9N9F2S6_9GLOM|nr:7920_t:CDS:10 [Acaulospora morrowiae]